jgi:hypothetical protein
VENFFDSIEIGVALLSDAAELRRRTAIVAVRTIAGFPTAIPGIVPALVAEA